MKTSNYNHDLSVTIIMATYNGAHYLEQQLLSLTTQTYKKWDLWIRDDHSSDTTQQIIEEYSKKDERVHFIHDQLGRLGNAQNFAEIMRHVGETDYYMFCDQDDVWYSDKIQLSVEKIIESEHLYPNVPILVHTDAEAVDSKLNTISTSFLRKIHANPFNDKPIGCLLAQNYIYGCTMILNKQAFNMSNPIPIVAEGHDYWVALVVAYFGKIIYLDQSTLKYRQHANNVTGLKQGNIISRIKRNLTLTGWKKINQIIDTSIRQAESLLDMEETTNIVHEFSNDKKKLMGNYVALCKRGGIQVIPFLIKNKIFRQGKLRTAIYFLSMLRKNKY